MNKSVLSAVFSLSVALVYAQNDGVLIDPSETLTREPSATLQVGALQSTIANDYGGFLVPRMTLANRGNIASPATGLLIYQTDNSPGYYYNSGTPGGPVWTRLIESVGSSNVTGSGAATRLAFWSGANTITSDANLYWDDVNDRLGLGTSSPGAKIQVAGTGSTNGLLVNDGNIYDEGAWLRINHNNTSTWWGDGNAYINFSDASGAKAFYFRDNSSVVKSSINSAGSAFFAGDVGVGAFLSGSALNLQGDRYATFGPNSTWGATLRVGGNGNIDSRAAVVATNGNLHLDAATGGYATYLNYYKGTSGVIFGNGASGTVGSVSNTGYLSMNNSINSGVGFQVAGGATAGNYLRGNGSNFVSSAIQSGDIPYGDASTGGPRAQGNFGQFQAHGTYTDFNTNPGYWGWNYVQGTGNAPNATSSQWYRNVVSLGSAYPARGSGGYSLELAFPRFNHSTSGVWMRTIENGGIGGWTRIDAGPNNGNFVWNQTSSAQSANFWVSGNGRTDGGMTTGVNGTYNTFHTWTNLPNHAGFYSSNHNGAHFYPNNGSYGSWRISGSRNGWGGIEFDSNGGNLTLMMNNGNGLGAQYSGVHNNSWGWLWYFYHQRLYASGLTDINNSSYYVDPDGGTVLTGNNWFSNNSGVVRIGHGWAWNYCVGGYYCCSWDWWGNCNGNCWDPCQSTQAHIKLSVHGSAESLGWWGWSDGRFKKNISDVPNALAMVRRMKGVTYDWKDLGDTYDERIINGQKESYNAGGTSDGNSEGGFKSDIGVIAQDLKEILPMAVMEVEDTDTAGNVIGTHFSVNYDKIIPVLIEAIKEQQEQIDELRLLVGASTNNGVGQNELQQMFIAMRQRAETMDSETQAHVEELISQIESGTPLTPALTSRINAFIVDGTMPQ